MQQPDFLSAASAPSAPCTTSPDGYSKSRHRRKTQENGPAQGPPSQRRSAIYMWRSPPMRCSIGTSTRRPPTGTPESRADNFRLISQPPKAAAITWAWPAGRRRTFIFIYLPEPLIAPRPGPAHERRPTSRRRAGPEIGYSTFPQWTAGAQLEPHPTRRTPQPDIIDNEHSMPSSSVAAARGRRTTWPRASPQSSLHPISRQKRARPKQAPLPHRRATQSNAPCPPQHARDPRRQQWWATSSSPAISDGNFNPPPLQ